MCVRGGPVRIWAAPGVERGGLRLHGDCAFANTVQARTAGQNEPAGCASIGGLLPGRTADAGEDPGRRTGSAARSLTSAGRCEAGSDAEAAAVERIFAETWVSFCGGQEPLDTKALGLDQGVSPGGAVADGDGRVHHGGGRK